MNDARLQVLRCLADTRSPVPYLANENSHNWETLQALRAEGLISSGDVGPACFGSYCVWTLSRPSSASMQRLAVAYAAARNAYSLQDTARSRELLAEFALAVEEWLQ